MNYAKRPRLTVLLFIITTGVLRMFWKKSKSGVVEDLIKIWEEHGAGENWPVSERVETLCSYLLERKNTSKLLFRDSDTGSEFATLLIQAAHVQTSYDQVFSYIKSQDSKRLMNHVSNQWNLSYDPAVASRRYFKNTGGNRGDGLSRRNPRMGKTEGIRYGSVLIAIFRWLPSTQSCAMGCRKWYCCPPIRTAIFVSHRSAIFWLLSKGHFFIIVSKLWREGNW